MFLQLQVAWGQHNITRLRIQWFRTPQVWQPTWTLSYRPVMNHYSQQDENRDERICETTKKDAVNLQMSERSNDLSKGSVPLHPLKRKSTGRTEARRKTRSPGELLGHPGQPASRGGVAGCLLNAHKCSASPGGSVCSNCTAGPLLRVRSLISRAQF